MRFLMIKICGIATFLPKSRLVREASQVSKNELDYRGWPRFCQASGSMNPSTMALMVAKQAIANAGIQSKQISHVLFNGISRDFPPSWSVAIEVMKGIKANKDCIGIDYTVGCLGTLMGLNLTKGLLREKKYALIICAEKWSYTIDRSDRKSMHLWGHSDGAAAIVVGNAGIKRFICTFKGADFSSHHLFNDLVRIKYGGTKFPLAPSREKKPFKRILAPVSTSEISKVYQKHLKYVFEKNLNKKSLTIDCLVINQMPKGILQRISKIFRLRENDICITGDRYGHVGSADIIIGLSEVLKRKDKRVKIVGVASTSACQYGFGIIKLRK
jgi:3-oxoacyl-[acyl-carrier-protein] synthase III